MLALVLRDIPPAARGLLLDCESRERFWEARDRFGYWRAETRASGFFAGDAAASAEASAAPPAERRAKLGFMFVAEVRDSPEADVRASADWASVVEAEAPAERRASEDACDGAVDDDTAGEADTCTCQD